MDAKDGATDTDDTAAVRLGTAWRLTTTSGLSVERQYLVDALGGLSGAHPSGDSRRTSIDPPPDTRVVFTSPACPIAAVEPSYLVYVEADLGVEEELLVTAPLDDSHGLRYGHLHRLHYDRTGEVDEHEVIRLDDDGHSGYVEGMRRLFAGPEDFLRVSPSR